MEILSNWFKANHLSLNTNKSVGILFGPKNKSMEVFTFDNMTLNIEDSTKFLGIWVNRDLSWKTHVSKLFNKIKQHEHTLPKQEPS